jgi:hypothetical protein
MAANIDAKSHQYFLIKLIVSQVNKNFYELIQLLM